jgi:hypothetical protein
MRDRALAEAHGLASFSSGFRDRHRHAESPGRAAHEKARNVPETASRSCSTSNTGTFNSPARLVPMQEGVEKAQVVAECERLRDRLLSRMDDESRERCRRIVDQYFQARATSVFCEAAE